MNVEKELEDFEILWNSVDRTYFSSFEYDIAKEFWLARAKKDIQLEEDSVPTLSKDNIGDNITVLTNLYDLSGTLIPYKLGCILDVDTSDNTVLIYLHGIEKKFLVDFTDIELL